MVVVLVELVLPEVVVVLVLLEVLVVLVELVLPLVVVVVVAGFVSLFSVSFLAASLFTSERS